MSDRKDAPLFGRPPEEWKWLDQQLDHTKGFLYAILNHVDGTYPSPIVPLLRQTNVLLGKLVAVVWVIAGLLAFLVYRSLSR